MKKTIENINEINDSSLNEMSASTITDFIKSELEKAADQYQQEMTEKEEALKAATEKSETLQAEHDQLTDELGKVKDALGELEKANTEREAEEKFNQRMSVLDEEYALNDEDREVIATDVKDLDDEGFEAYQKKMSTLIRHKNKELLAEEKEAAEATELAETKETPAVAEEASASEETNAKDESSESEEAVEEALENAEAEASTVPVSTPAEEPTVHDKFRKAFDLDGWELKN